MMARRGALDPPRRGGAVEIRRQAVQRRLRGAPRRPAPIPPAVAAAAVVMAAIVARSVNVVTSTVKSRLIRVVMAAIVARSVNGRPWAVFDPRGP